MTEDERPDLPARPERPPGKVLSANQLVSYNLMRARREAGWSQAEVAELLEKYTGRTWSNASVSAAERAWQGGRPRRFDASEIVAFSRMFDQPIPYFFMPPDTERYWAEWVGMREFDDGVPDPASVSDSMGLVATSELVKALAMADVSQRFSLRMAELTTAWLGLSWRKAELVFPFREIRSMDELYEERQTSGTEWGDVALVAESDGGDVVEVTVTPEQISDTLDQIMGDVKQSVLQRLLTQAKNPREEEPRKPRHTAYGKRNESSSPPPKVSSEVKDRMIKRLLEGPAGGA